MASRGLLSSLPIETQQEVRRADQPQTSTPKRASFAAPVLTRARPQMIKFMKFFKEKREHTLVAIDGDFDDTVEDRLRSMDPPYSFDDVSSALDHLQICVKDGVRADLSKMLGMNVLLIKNLLETADAQGLTLHVDTSIVEDEALIQEVDKIRLDAPPRAEPKGLQARNLKSLKDEQKELSDRNSSLEDSNKTLQQRFNALQQQCASVLREKGDLAEELRQCKRQLEAQNSSSAAQAKRDRDELAGAKGAMEEGGAQLAGIRRELAETKHRLRQSEDDLEAKLTNSRQFSDLKKQLQKKNALVSDLRAQLASLGVTDGLDADDRVRR